MFKLAEIGALSLAVGVAVGTARAQTCAVSNADFKLTNLASTVAGNEVREPIKMAFDVNGSNVDVYFVERKGRVRKFVGASKTVVTIGTLTDMTFEFEDGLAGIALDPGFKSNKWVYLYYSHGKAGDFRFRVSRFTLDGAGNLNLASERILLTIPGTFKAMHTGGAMTFDKHGNLWITVGDNNAGEIGPGNTNDLRGKILRIKPIAFPDNQTPTPGVGTTYTIPEGNMFQASAQTRPEIYIMGTRNAYSISLDPVRNAVVWGDVGPDGAGITEEHNMAVATGNYGWPYYAGDQVALATGGAGKTPTTIQNNHAQNTGLKALPPAVPGTNNYRQNAAVTGPVWRTPAPIPGSAIKPFPSQFEGVWFVADFSTGQMDTIRMDAAGRNVVAKGPVFRTQSLGIVNPLDIQMGPDGALYVIDYNAGYWSFTSKSGLYRIEYTGSCAVGISRQAPLGNQLAYRGRFFDVADVGSHVLSVSDVQGREVARFEGKGQARYDLSSVEARPGVYTARLTTAGGELAKAVVLGR